MSNFENIKVGDVILVQVSAHTVSGWRRRRFSVARKVEKVTPAQFTADGLRYTKSYGNGVGHSSVARHPGGREDLKDQTAELKGYKERMSLLWDIQKLSEKLIAETRNPDTPLLKVSLENLKDAKLQLKVAAKRLNVETDD